MTLFQCEIRILFSFQRVVIPSQEGVYHLILDSQQEIVGMTNYRINYVDTNNAGIFNSFLTFQYLSFH